MMNTALVIPVRLFGRWEGFLHSWGCFRLFLLVLLLCSPAVVFSQQRWERNYGGGNGDYSESVLQASDGGYIVAGYTESFGNGYQVYLLKINASGDTLWTKTYGDPGYDFGRFVQQNQDLGYIIAGESSSQVRLIKTNAFGDTLWTRAYGGANYEDGNSVQQTQDGGYIIVGYTTSYGIGGQIFLIRTNANGDTLWTRNYGGTDIDLGNSVQQTQDGGYVVAGYTTSFGDGYQVYLVKTNSLGDTLWTRTYGGAGYEEGHSVQQTQDLGYIIAGTTGSFGNNNQVYLIKTDVLGDTLWTRNFGGANIDIGNSVEQTQDSGYIIAGYTYSIGNPSQVYLIKTNSLGDTLWTETYGEAGDDRGFSVRQTQDGGYIIAGQTASFGNGYQVYLIKTDANGSSGAEENTEIRDQWLENRITAKPNPFTSFATVPGHEGERFSLYDVSGRKVGVYKGDRIGSGLSAGVYFLRPQEGDAKPVRVVKIR